MGYWNEVKEVVLKGMNLAMEGIKEGADVALEKSKDGVQFAQLKKNLFFEHNKLRHLLTDLGDKVNDLYKNKADIYADGTVQEIMKNVINTENECRRIEEEIKKLKDRL